MSTKTKPEKPYPEFPLNAHASGKWTKKIKGKSRYFGTWDNPLGALAEYDQAIAQIESTHEPVKVILTLAMTADQFIDFKERAWKSKDIVRRTFDEYRVSTIRFVEFMGRTTSPRSLKPINYQSYRDHLEQTGLGPRAVSNEVNRIRVFMRWVYQTHFDGLLPNFGPGFKPMTKKAKRRVKEERGSLVADPKDILTVLAEASVHMRAQILLGLNCGYGQTDVACVPLDAIKAALDPNHDCCGYIVWRREKTGIGRAACLWPETIAALQASLDARSKPQNGVRCFFLTAKGESLDCHGKGYLIPGRFTALCRSLGVDISFKWLRHTFKTVANQSRDPEAVNLFMGHTDGRVGEVYTHDLTSVGIEPERLIAVADKVRGYIGLKRPTTPDPYQIAACGNC